MKLPKEYTIILIVGLFILSYALEAVVQPLKANFTSPYAFLQIEQLSKYPFTSTVIFIRATAFFLLPLWIYSFIPKGYFAKGSILIVLGALMQLYSLQEVATNTTLAPLEWSLSLSVAGIAILLPAIFYLLFGIIFSMGKKLSSDPAEEPDGDEAPKEPKY